MLAAASFHPQLVKGLILLNAAGRFEESSSKAKVEMAEPSEGNEFEETVKTKGAENSLLVTDTPGSIGTTPGSLKSVLIDIVVEPIKKAAQRMILFLTFLQAKQPIRIRQVLNSVGSPYTFLPFFYLSLMHLGPLKHFLKNLLHFFVEKPEM